MTKWRYLQVFSDGESSPVEWNADGDASLTIPTGSTPVEVLNQLGSGGWELVAVSAVRNIDIYWFKQPR